MRREDAGIDDIDSHAGARSAAHISPVEWESALIDSIQSPRRLRGVNSGILFDELHTRVARERLCVGITDLDRETLETAPICMVDSPAVETAHCVCNSRSICARVENQNISPRNVSCAAMNTPVATENRRSYQNDAR